MKFLNGLLKPKIFQTREEYGFLSNPPLEVTVKSMEKKTTRVFC